MLFYKSRFFTALAVVSAVLLLGQLRIQWPQEAISADAKLWTEKTSSEKGKGNGLDIDALNRVFVDLTAGTSPAVVNIYTKTRVARQQPSMPNFGNGNMAPDDLFQFFFGNPFGGGGGFQPPPREAQTLGSGFAINDQGIIITNSHVVRMSGRNADSVMVKFIGESDRSKGHEATILGVDEGTDVAVLKLKNVKKDLKLLSLGNSDNVKVGEWVIAIGNPYGHSNSVTKGIVSALGRNLEQSRADFIQTDASINPGNSGGPLINLFGEVVGINTAIDARAQGIGFAIPINTAKSVIKQIIEKGGVTLGWIGVSIADVDPQVAESLGLKNIEGAVLIQDVFPGEPASKAGVKSYDIVTEVNGKKLNSSRDFSILVGNLPVGSKAELKIIRDSKPVNLTVTVAKRKNESELAQNFSQKGQGPSRPSGKQNSAGLQLAELTSELRSQLDLGPGVSGVVIARVRRGSPASVVGLESGDLITEINRKRVRTVAEAETLLSKKSDSVLLKVQRRQASIIVSLDLREPDTEDDNDQDDGQ